MVHIDMITTAGAVLAGLAIQVPLAAGAFDPVAHAGHMRALMTTASSADQCADQALACGEDQSCLECSQLYADSIEACGEQAVANNVSDDGCVLLEDILCCATESCHDNAAYAGLLGAHVFLLFFHLPSDN